MTNLLPPDAAAIRAYRDEHGCGLLEARTILRRDWRKWRLQDMRDCLAKGAGVEIVVHELLDFLLDEY